jgi:hypothetical protein
MKRLVLILFGTIALVAGSYWIYLCIPYTSEEFKSPYGNATIKTVLDGKLPFFSFNAGTVDGNYVILYDDKVVDKLLRSECCYINEIKDINWFKDSVKFTYIDNFDAPPVVYGKVYKFAKTNNQPQH